jgi:SP family sugar:H+ symporter-like MFS transporter
MAVDNSPPYLLASVADRTEAAEIDHSFVILISVVATIGGFLFGYDSGVINGTVDGLRAAFNSNSMGTGFSVSSMLLGCAAGAFLAGQASDKIGRWWVLMISAIFFVISGCGSGSANSALEFIIYRIIGGLAVGAASVICPAYISEVTPAYYRGKLSSVQQIAIISGLFFSFLSNYCLAKFSGSSLAILWLGYATWRWMFWMELIPAITFLLLLLLIPESPRFLVSRGRHAKAEAVLGKIYGAVGGKAKAAAIHSTLRHDHKPSFADLIDKIDGKIRPIIWVGIGLAVLQQLVGINVVFYYGAVLWQAAGFSESDALLTNVITGATSIVACLVTFFVVDRIGRKPLLWFGSIGMSVTLGLMAFAFSGAPVDASGNLKLSAASGTLALISANLYVLFFNLSWGPVMWVMLGEMFPNQIRGSALAIAGLAQWLANFVITWTFPMLLASALGLSGAYGIYTAFSLISIVFVIKYVRETKGKELEQMEG